MARRPPLKRLFTVDNRFNILKKQLEACGKSVQHVFSHYGWQQSEAEQLDGSKLEMKDGKAHCAKPPKLDEQLSSGQEISTDKQSGNPKDSSDKKWSSQLAWLSNILEPALQLYKRVLPPGDSENGPSPASTRSLAEIATSLYRSTLGMQEWSLGDLTLGLYLLSLRHASEMAVDNIRGEQIFSDYVVPLEAYSSTDILELNKDIRLQFTDWHKSLRNVWVRRSTDGGVKWKEESTKLQECLHDIDNKVQDLIYHVELAKGAYMKDAAGLARNSMLRESNILKFISNSNVMRPGYYIGVDIRNKLVVLGIRGTHTVHDIVTDMVSLSNQEVSFDGFQVHFGTVEAARWFFCHELETLRKCLEMHKGFGLRLVGHSLGGAAAALLAIMLRKRSEKELGFSPDIISAVGIATPPCTSKKLAEDCLDFVTTVVLQDDAIPRMCGASLARLRNEILLTDWTSLLEREERKGVADIVVNTMQALSSAQDAARKCAAYARLSSANELGDKSKKETEGSEVTCNKSLCGLSSDKGDPNPLALKPIEIAEEELFAPGTLFHIRGRCVSIAGKKTTGGRESCTLWKGYPDEHFGRIVLSDTMLSDHKCDNHYYALRDVLKGLPKSDDRRLP